MPELPNVEGFRAVLAEHGTGGRVEHVEVMPPGPRTRDRSHACWATRNGHEQGILRPVHPDDGSMLKDYRRQSGILPA